MPHNGIRISKDLGGDALTVSATPSRPPASSDSRSGKGRILLFKPRVNGTDPQPPRNTPDGSCSPVRYRLEDFRSNIVAAARSGRHYRSIAAQYGLNALEVWEIVTNELQTRRAA